MNLYVQNSNYKQICIKKWIFIYKLMELRELYHILWNYLRE